MLMATFSFLLLGKPSHVGSSALVCLYHPDWFRAELLKASPVGPGGHRGSPPREASVAVPATPPTDADGAPVEPAGGATQPTGPDHYIKRLASRSPQLALERILSKLGSLQPPYLTRAKETMASLDGAGCGASSYRLASDQLTAFTGHKQLNPLHPFLSALGLRSLGHGSRAGSGARPPPGSWLVVFPLTRVGGGALRPPSQGTTPIQEGPPSGGAPSAPLQAPSPRTITPRVRI